MGFLDKLFKFNRSEVRQPEDLYDIIVTEDMITVVAPSNETGQIRWTDINEIWFYNTDKGPIEPDVWLVLIGESGKCALPQGNKIADEVYYTVSKYENFNYKNAIASATCTDNVQFLLWKRDDKL